jgi:acyl carrier protein
LKPSTGENMEKKEIFDIIKGYFISQFEVPEDKITMDALLKDDLGLDSIDALDMIGMLEARLNMEIEGEELKNIRTVRDVVEFIYQKIQSL